MDDQMTSEESVAQSRVESADEEARPLRPDTEKCNLVVAEVGSNVAACYQCAKCSAGCPVSEITDLLPHRVIRLAQLGQKQELLGSKHIWLCTGCGTCSERCPNQVDVALVMDRLKAQAMRTGATVEQVEAARFHKIFLDSVERFGRAHEFGVLRRLRGMGGMMKDMKLGLEMMRRGKIKISASKVRDREEIREIYRRAEEDER